MQLDALPAFERERLPLKAFFFNKKIPFGKNISLPERLDSQARIAATFDCPSLSLHTLTQRHSADVFWVTSPPFPQEGDGLITDVPNQILGILTADCVPVLIYCPTLKRIAALHAGWRGALAGIVPQTLRQFKKDGSDLKALYISLGPCIHQASYEVDASFRDYFLQTDPSALTFFKESPRFHFLFDLPGYIIRQCFLLGAHQISAPPLNTYVDNEFFSYRRYCHHPHKKFANQISAIMLV
jgi:YfiH family protein